MFTKFRIGESAVCHCGTSLMTVEHFLQDCQTHQNLRAETWYADTPVREKIYGPVGGEPPAYSSVRPSLPESLSEQTTTTKKKKPGCPGVSDWVTTLSWKSVANDEDVSSKAVDENAAQRWTHSCGHTVGMR